MFLQISSCLIVPLLVCVSEGLSVCVCVCLYQTPVFLCFLPLGVCAFSPECVSVMSVSGCHCEDGDYGESWKTRCSACCPLVSICKSRSENAWGHHWLRWEGALVGCESRILCRCPREACFALADSPWSLLCLGPWTAEGPSSTQYWHSWGLSYSTLPPRKISRLLSWGLQVNSCQVLGGS